MKLLSTSFYVLLSILGLSAISLGGLIGVQYFRGKIHPRDIHSMMRVIGGTHRIIIPNDAYDRFLAFSKDEQAARVELEQNRGLPTTRVPAAMRAQELQAAQQENLQVLNRLLAAEQRKVADVRAEVEGHKVQVANLLRALNTEREKNAIVERDAATAKLRNMLAEMDAGNIAAFLDEVCLDPSQGGPTEAARIIRVHLQADFAAEVLGEIPQSQRQKILPLLENRFAGVPPDAVVKIFADNSMSPGEQMVFMTQMNPSQALGVYLRLPPEVQQQIAPQLLRGQ